MATLSASAPEDVTERSRGSISSLIVGLIEDFKLLMAQEVRLAKHEIQEEMAKARAAAVSAGIGMGCLALGGLMLIIMLVHLLHALTPLPLWTCYGIVGGGLLGAGALLLRKSKGRASDLSLVPRRTIQTMKENATWMKEQAKSGTR